MRLKPGKGVNFPSTELDLPPLTSKDFRDLDFIAEQADLIGYSFVQRVDDIELLQDHLVARAPKREPQGLVLKIETPLAVRNLPTLILQSAAHNPTAVMIARGDLAVEIGFARLDRNAGGNPVAVRGRRIRRWCGRRRCSTITSATVWRAGPR